MAAYYNEIDPFAADWLRNLIAAGRLADGFVDTRSIVDVKPDDLEGFTQCHFFAGVGIWGYALRQAGWPDERPVWSASLPCQPFSSPGKRRGVADERHLWPAFHWLVEQRKPAVIYGEQVASKDGLAWLDLVCTDLEGSGYACAPFDLPAAGFGAPHIRQRLYFAAKRLGDPLSTGLEGHPRDVTEGHESGRDRTYQTGPVTEASSLSLRGPVNGFWEGADWVEDRAGHWRPVQPGLKPLDVGSANRMGRCRAYGNAVVSEVATNVIRAFMDSQ